jgi:hypothetical protein
MAVRDPVNERPEEMKSRFQRCVVLSQSLDDKNGLLRNDARRTQKNDKSEEYES